MLSATPNHLIGETSPYLLQHAYNPVEWYPWGEAALQKARAEQKPILVSIGYAACHWCHVMERESFENPATAALMNAHFVNIKIDREERPDLDHIYMDALQAMNGNGGWPLNVFLTPEGKPFYGGTYFPPVAAYNRASWTDVLQRIEQAWQERRDEIMQQAENLTSHLQQSNRFGLTTPTDDQLFTTETLATLSHELLKNADTQWGGFGNAPKFPQTASILYLLRYHHCTGDVAALTHANLSLQKMAQGGLYDQLGGGFARYSTDAEWLAPHFEKMLYDNALLIGVYAEAYQLTKNPQYHAVITQTIDFVQRELFSDEGGFYAALDADSEGVEGKFYTWAASEIDEVLGEEAALFKEIYAIAPEGNWEHTNILWLPQSIASICEKKGLATSVVEKKLEHCRARLFNVRAQRSRPALDDKIILGWNALMNKALSKAYAATGISAYRDLAIRNMQFCLEKFQTEQGAFHHTYKNEARYPAFLEDLAYVADALLHLQEITGNTEWLTKAQAVVELIERDFSDTESPFFFYTSAYQQDLIVRKKEIYDGAVPSGNAVVARVLHQLSLLLDRPKWAQKSQQMVKIVGNAIKRHPNSFGNWAGLLQEMVLGTNEITIIGPEAPQQLSQVLQAYIPHRVLMSAVRTDDRFALLRGKTTDSLSAIWLCRNQTCLPPVATVEQLLACLQTTSRNNS
jgi:uncharacterized protein YyaL (SSP411 family)